MPFGAECTEMTLRTIEKALGKQRFQSGRTRTQKTLETVSKTLFCEDAKCVAKTLIKPVESIAVWRQNAEMAPKMMEKH